MISKQYIFALMCLLISLSAGAQGRKEKIELLEIDGAVAVFSSEGIGTDREHALENSIVMVLHQILYDGVESFNGGYPIVDRLQNHNLWLNDFFIGKYPKYTSFIEGVELIGGFDTAPTGQVHCKTNVQVKHQYLLQQAKINGVVGADEQPRAKTTPYQDKRQQKKPSRSFL